MTTEFEQQAQREKRLGMIQQNALRDGEHDLMEMEEEKNQSEAADGMLRIDPRADG